MTARIFLGTHKPQWLGRLPVPLFISYRRLRELKKLRLASAPWAIDSGGFTELNKHGAWTIKAADYARDVRRYVAADPLIQWAAIQDWMCEPFVLKKTGRTIAQHQAWTIDSYAELLRLAPDLPWAPVLQGFEAADYLRHADAYAFRGFDLHRAPVVGLGSVCRRQSTGTAELLARELAARGLKLHGFGFKVLGLRRVSEVLTSSDSLAWSFDARHRPPLPGCRHASCANCQIWAMRWLERAQRQIATRESQAEFAGMRQ